MVKIWLTYPISPNLSVDDPRTIEFRCQLIQKKSFLRKLYKEWYEAIVSALTIGDGLILELGSGAGFLRDYIPGLITSDVFMTSNVRIVLDGCYLPFKDGVLKGIVMVDVFHHLPEPRRFLEEASRCVCPGGAMVMIEPWVTAWSQWVYKTINHEPFLPDKKEWEFARTGPLSGANGALAWIIFKRDILQFKSEFPQWNIRMIKPIVPFCYIFSGGFSFVSLMPSWTYGLWRLSEKSLKCFMNKLAMFAQIELVRI